MANTTLFGVILAGLASARPAANAVAKGTVYSATDTGVITQSDGVSTWSTWATIASGMANPMSHQNAMIVGGAGGAPQELTSVASKFLQTDGSGVVSWGAAPPSLGLLGFVSYDGHGGYYSTASTSLVDVDATNLAVTFNAPASGNVLVRISGRALQAVGGAGGVGVREASSIVKGPVLYLGPGPSDSYYYSFSIPFYITGISAGSHTYKVAFAASASGTLYLTCNTNTPIIMEIWG